MRLDYQHSTPPNLSGCRGQAAGSRAEERKAGRAPGPRDAGVMGAGCWELDAEILGALVGLRPFITCGGICSL